MTGAWDKVPLAQSRGMEGKSAPHVKFLSAAAEAKLSFPGLNTAGFITAQAHAQAPPLLPCKLDKPLKQIISSSLEKHLVLSDEKPRPPSAGSNHRFIFFQSDKSFISSQRKSNYSPSHSYQFMNLLAVVPEQFFMLRGLALYSRLNGYP